MLVLGIHYELLIGARYILQWGFVGVDLFFVLSGFLITGILYDALQSRRYFRDFYIRRSLRIFPLFYTFWLVALLLTPFLHVAWNRYHLAAMFYVGNVFIPGATLGLHPDPFVLPITPLQPRSISINPFWSLCVEEQFYLLWPLVVWFVRSRRNLLRICLTVAVVMPFFRWLLFLKISNGYAESGFLYYATFTRFDSLLIGGAIALWLRGRPNITRLRTVYNCLIFVPLIVLAAVLLSPLNRWPSWDLHVNPVVDTFGLTLLALFATGLLLAALHPPSLVHRVFKNKLLTSIGRLSYGIYVMHSIPLNLFGGHHLAFLREHHLIPYFALPLIYGAAWISFRFLESPFLRLKDRWAPQTRHVSDPPPIPST